MNLPYYSLLINSRIAVQKPYYAKLKTNEWKNLEFSVRHADSRDQDHLFLQELPNTV